MDAGAVLEDVVKLLVPKPTMLCCVAYLRDVAVDIAEQTARPNDVAN